MTMRRSVFAVLVVLACGGDSTSGGPDSGANEGSASESGSSDGSSADGGSNSESESGSADGASAEGGSGPPDVDCEDPEPILQPDTELPTGFERCSDGFIHRVDAVTCAEPTPADTCKVTDELAECMTAADCGAQPYGACDQEPAWQGGGCGCVYGCESDADCGAGEICACDGAVPNGPRCIPAGCVTDAECDGLCGWSPIGSGCGALGYQVACLDGESECRTSCPEVEGCYGNLGEPRCEIIEGEWTCNVDSLCEDCG